VSMLLIFLHVCLSHAVWNKLTHMFHS